MGQDAKDILEVCQQTIAELRQKVVEQDDYIRSLEDALDEVRSYALDVEEESIVEQGEWGLAKGAMSLFHFICKKLPDSVCVFTGEDPYRFAISKNPETPAVVGIGATPMEAFVDCCKKFMIQFGETIDPDTGLPKNQKQEPPDMYPF